jgi:hypothetical protein
VVVLALGNSARIEVIRPARRVPVEADAVDDWPCAAVEGIGGPPIGKMSVKIAVPTVDMARDRKVMAE